MSKQRAVSLAFEGEALESVFVGRRDDAARPLVILFPTVMGVSELELRFGRQLVELGYSAFVADVFGKRFRGSPRETMIAEMNRLKQDRAGLRRRVCALFDQVLGLDGSTPATTAAAGFCFGGMCALDLARSGADLAGVASFHGLLDPPGLPPQRVTAKVIAFHGWDDPLARPDQCGDFDRHLARDKEELSRADGLGIRPQCFRGRFGGDRGQHTQAALVTLFERRQRVQTRMRRVAPLMSAFTRCRFGSNRRALTLWAWLILRPTTGALPQISQVLAMMSLGTLKKS